MMTRIHDKIPDLKHIGPDLLDEWLEQSRAGDVISRNKMLIWVHRSALEYFQAKVPLEALLTTADAWDMASESVIEFERSWIRVRRVGHYCRRMYKNNLNRFLKRKRRLLRRELALDITHIERANIESAVANPRFEFERLSDGDKRKIATAQAELDQADPALKCLFEYRVFSGRLTYAEIGEILGTSETSLRMRMTRFNRRVKNRHAQLVSFKDNDVHRPPISRMEFRPIQVDNV